MIKNFSNINVKKYNFNLENRRNITKNWEKYLIEIKMIDLFIKIFYQTI